jgi:hypothetical protein
MDRCFKHIWLMMLLLVAAPGAHAFSLLAPPAAQAPGFAWQVPRIGYNLPGDIGGVASPGEEYRWNLPNITYAFDSSFLEFFGVQGVEAVEAALGLINGLGPVSQLPEDLPESIFPKAARALNQEAASMGLVDLKTTTLRFVLEILGLTDPTRYVYTIRNRATFGQNPTITNYFVFQRNYDPVTYQSSQFINDVWYSSYHIIDPVQINNMDVALILNIPAANPTEDPLLRPLTSFLEEPLFLTGSGDLILASAGVFAFNLSRDDVGGLRYLYRAQNYNVENLFTNVTLATNGVAGNVVSPWVPYFGITNIFTNVFGNTNITGTNALIGAFLRPGMETISFVRTDYDSLLGQAFITITNVYTDVVVSNNTAVMQRVQRISNQPDLLFTAEDLGLNPGNIPFFVRRGVNYVNNDAINGQSVLGGPGTLEPPAVISFTRAIPGYITFHALPDGPPMTAPVAWGSFDQTTIITVYPNDFSLQQLQQMVLGP